MNKYKNNSIISTKLNEYGKICMYANNVRFLHNSNSKDFLFAVLKDKRQRNIHIFLIKMQFWFQFCWNRRSHQTDSARKNHDKI